MYLTKQQTAQAVQAVIEQSPESNRAKARAVLDAIGKFTDSYSHFSEDNFLYNAQQPENFGFGNFPYRSVSPKHVISENSNNFVSSHQDLILVWAYCFGMTESGELQIAPSSKPGWVKVLN